MAQEQDYRSLDTTDPAGKDPAAIEDDIARTRADMDSTLDEIQNRLSPDMLLNQARSYLRGNTDGGREFVDNLTESVRRNPIPVALIGIGIGWLMMSGRRGYQADRHLPVPVDQAAPMASGGDIMTESSAARRDEVDRHGVTAEDEKARQQPPGSAMPRGL